MARLITHACMVFCLLRSLLAARFCAVYLRVDLISSIFVLVWAMFSHLFRFHLGARELVALVDANPWGFLLPFFCYLIVSWVVVVFVWFLPERGCRQEAAAQADHFVPRCAIA